MERFKLIAQLIIKYQFKIAMSEDDNNTLHQWRQQSQENEKFMQEFANLETFYLTINKLRKGYQNMSWNKILAQINANISTQEQLSPDIT